MDAEQGQPVGEDVVHLAGDGLAGEPLRLFGAEPGLGLGPLGPLAQGDDELPPGPYGHAPADHQQGQQRPDDRGLDERGARVGTQIGLYRGEDQGERPDGRHGPERAVHGHAEQRDEHGSRRDRLDRGDQDQAHRDAERPPPPHPQRAAGQGTDHDVGEQDALGCGGVGLDRRDRDHAHRDRAEEGGQVDGPVPHGASRAAAPVAGQLGVGHRRGQQPAVFRTGHATKLPRSGG